MITCRLASGMVWLRRPVVGDRPGGIDVELVVDTFERHVAVEGHGGMTVRLMFEYSASADASESCPKAAKAESRQVPSRLRPRGRGRVRPSAQPTKAAAASTATDTRAHRPLATIWPPTPHPHRGTDRQPAPEANVTTGASDIQAS